MNLKFYFSVLFLFAFFVSSGQKHIVRGVIRDSVNNETIPYANVIMYGLADNYMGGVVSDSLGRFNICIDSVDHIKFSHIEYVRKDIKISSIKGKDFCILLSRNDVMLEGVNIISKIKAKEGFNTLQYNFSNSITDSILFSENLLKLIPCIDVSPNGPLRVNGNSNVSYTINGKPADQKQIESLPSSIIKSIELKTIPDAYLLNMGAQSAINIITKAKENGSLDVLINPFATTNLRLINCGAAINYFYKKIILGLRGNYWNRDISKNGRKNLTSSIGNYSYLNSKSVSDTDKELWLDFDLFLTPDKIFNNSIYVSNYKLTSTGKV